MREASTKSQASEESAVDPGIDEFESLDTQNMVGDPDGKTAELSNDANAWDEIRIRVHTARKGSGGTDRPIYIYASFRTTNGVGWKTHWLEMLPINSNPYSFEQGGWDDLWYREPTMKIQMVGWTMRLAGRNEKIQKWSYDQMYWYGRMAGGTWNYIGGVNHGEGYKTVDSFDVIPGTYIESSGHTVTAG